VDTINATGAKNPEEQNKPKRIALVTGTLAQPALRKVCEELKQNKSDPVTPTIITLNIQVAALVTTDWLMRKLELPQGDQPPIDLVILPGYCRGGLEQLAEKLGVPVQRGPQNVHDLPEFLGHRTHNAKTDYGQTSIEIIAEINHAAHLPIEQIIETAQQLTTDGADLIDIGCDPQADRPAWTGVFETVAALRERGMRVSVDSFHPEEIELAAQADAELLLSVNSTNRHLAHTWKRPAGQLLEVVAIPDTPDDLASLDETINVLEKNNVPFRIDPILEPINFGFAKSIARYIRVRETYPNTPIMMGIGNLTEMTEVDSAGINMMLIGICQELDIASVLTTQVINWAKSSVREIDVARQLAHYAQTRGTPPKHIDQRLVMLRDHKLRQQTQAELEQLASKLTDPNIRLFTQGQNLHAMNRDVHAVETDPFLLFDHLKITEPSHAFYLGYEMAKAMTAITLDKNYTQDEPLNWGLLTRDEITHYERRKKKNTDETK
jgi:dihydropteroate synthase